MTENLDTNLAAAQEMLRACDYRQAQEYFERALSLAENGSTSLNKYLDCLIGLSTVYGQTGAFDQAEAIVILALSTIQKQVGKDHFLYGSHLNNLAFVRLHQGRLKEAEQVLLEAIVIIEKCFDSTHPELLKPLENLGHIYQEQKQIGKAVQSWQRAISIRTQCYGADDAGIKFFKDVCREALSDSRKSQRKTKTAGKENDVQLSLF